MARGRTHRGAVGVRQGAVKADTLKYADTQHYANRLKYTHAQQHADFHQYADLDVDAIANRNPFVYVYCVTDAHRNSYANAYADDYAYSDNPLPYLQRWSGRRSYPV